MIVSPTGLLKRRQTCRNSLVHSNDPMLWALVSLFSLPDFRQHLPTFERGSSMVTTGSVFRVSFCNRKGRELTPLGHVWGIEKWTTWYRCHPFGSGPPQCEVGGTKARRAPQVTQLASRTRIPVLSFWPPQHESFGLYHGDPWRKLSERRNFLDHWMKALPLGLWTFGEMGAFLSSPDFSYSENHFWALLEENGP